MLFFFFFFFNIKYVLIQYFINNLYIIKQKILFKMYKKIMLNIFITFISILLIL